MENRLEPSLELFPRQATKAELRETTRSSNASTAICNVTRFFRANRRADENTRLLQLRDQKLERIPRRAIGPLNVLEHDSERARRRRGAQIRHELLQQRVGAGLVVTASPIT